MNFKKILIGGLVSGIVMDVIDAIINGAMLGDRWRAATVALVPALAEQRGPPIGWIVTDLILGFFVAWTYAAIRPRYGAGPKTGLIAGLAKFVAGGPILASFAFLHLYPLDLVCGGLVSSLVAGLAGGLAAGALYSE